MIEITWLWFRFNENALRYFPFNKLTSFPRGPCERRNMLHLLSYNSSAIISSYCTSKYTLIQWIAVLRRKLLTHLALGLIICCVNQVENVAKSWEFFSHFIKYLICFCQWERRGLAISFHAPVYVRGQIFAGVLMINYNQILARELSNFVLRTA